MHQRFLSIPLAIALAAEAPTAWAQLAPTSAPDSKRPGSAGAATGDEDASAPQLDQRARRERVEAQYRRNIYAVQASFGRVFLPDITDGWEGRAEFAMLFPEQDSASTMMVAVMGVSGWGGDDGWGFGTPFGFGWGFRTPALVGYFGPLVGIGVDEGTEPAAPSFGGMADIGFDAGGFRLMFDARAEYRIMKYGYSRWHLGYGALASVDL